jgi:enoyl-CoA hydratase/carnithine racemase
MSALVHVEVAGAVATVRLDGPAKHNVLDSAGWRSLSEAFRDVSSMDGARCVVVRGTGGRAFSAGSDIAAFAEQRESPRDVRGYSELIARALRSVWACPHPTLAVIEGLCVGGGLEIAACCDLRVCETSSRFGAPITRLGLTMSYDELAPLVHLLGPGPVLEVLLTGELIDADRALAVGLVSRVFEDGSAVEQGYALAAKVASGAPLVNRWHKRFVRRLLHPAPLTDAEREETHQAFDTEDYREGRAAFMEKRSPDFRGV